MKNLVDLYMVYQFIRRLSTPFNKWDAHRLGIIDDKGNILKKKLDRKSVEERQAFTKFDLLILKLKRLLEKVPGGSNQIASYAAALWLIREWNHFTTDSLLTESIPDSILDESIELFFSRYCYYTRLVDDVNQKMNETPTVNVGSGAIAGLGIGPDGEPGLTPSQMKRYKRRNKKKTLRDVIGAKI
jgi:hypothetical protein